MRNPFIVIFIGCLVLAGCNKNKERHNQISIGTIDSLYSDVLKEQRKIWVYVPPGEEIYSSPRYPVVYLLDGNSHFHSVTGLLTQLVENGRCPEMIVVAIPNTDRSRDLTPSNSLKLPDGKPNDFLKTTGGAENFTMFIQKELIPYIEAHYPTAPHRMLIGHSFGGLFAVNTLINHPELFNTYVAIDPSMWWDDRKLLNQSEVALKNNRFDGKSLFLSVANTMDKGMDTLHVKADTASSSSHIRSILSFAKYASQSKGNGLTFGWKYYDDDDHGSVPLISEYDAFRFIYGFTRWTDSPEPTIEDIKNHTKMVSQKMGYEMLPPEPQVNNFGYRYLQGKKLDRAYSFFALNIENYPNSYNAFDSMGDYYLAAGDTVKAAENFSKSLTLKEIPGTREKLEKAKKKQK